LAPPPLPSLSFPFRRFLPVVPASPVLRPSPSAVAPPFRAPLSAPSPACTFARSELASPRPAPPLPYLRAFGSWLARPRSGPFWSPSVVPPAAPFGRPWSPWPLPLLRVLPLSPWARWRQAASPALCPFVLSLFPSFGLACSPLPALVAPPSPRLPRSRPCRPASPRPSPRPALRPCCSSSPRPAPPAGPSPRPA